MAEALPGHRGGRRAGHRSGPHGRVLAALLGAVILLHAAALTHLGGALSAPWRGEWRGPTASFSTRQLALDAPPAAPAAPAAVPTPRQRAAPVSPADARPTAHADRPPVGPATSRDEAPASEAPPQPQAAASAPPPDAPARAGAPQPAAPTVAPEPAQTAAGTGMAATGAAAGPHEPQPVAVPPPVRLRYEVQAQTRGLLYQARSELVWRHDGQRYDAALEVSALFVGSRTQTSVGQIGAGGLEPLRFGDRSRSERAAHFRWDTGRISFSATTADAPLLPGAQDQLSVFIQLAALLGGSERLRQPGQAIVIQTATARDAEPWRFRVEAAEALDTPIGRREALRLLRQPRREHDQAVELWFARESGWLPVRIRLAQANGDFVDMQLRGESPP